MGMMTDHSTARLSGLRLRKARLIRKAGTFLLVLFLSAFALVYVWQRVQVIRLGYEIEGLKRQKEDLVKTNRGLQIEAATLTSPDRIETIAARDMGMKTPAENQIVMVRRVGGGPGARADGVRHAERSKPAPGRS